MKRPKNVMLGGVFMLLFSIFLGMMAGLSKFAQETASPYQVVFFQQLVGLVCITPVVLARRGIRGLATKRFSLHLTRDVAGVLAYLTLFMTVRYVPLVNAVLFNNTGPLFVPFIVAFWFHKRIPWQTWIGILIGFAGVVLILQPGGALFQPVMILGLVSGFCMAITFVTQRILNKTEGLFLVLFYYFLVSSIVMLPLAIWQWMPLDPHTLGALIGIGILNLAAQNCMVFAFSYYTTSILAPLIYFAVIWSGIIDWIFWQTIPNWLSLTGIALVILGGVLSLVLGPMGRTER